MSRAFLILVFLFPFIAFSQRAIPIESTPSWATSVTYPLELADTVDTGGYSFLLLERQFNEKIKHSFYRRALKIDTEKGLEFASTFSINFDPSYQQLSIVGIKIFRDGKEINKTKSTKVETLRREQNMERMLYDKSLDAVINLTDTQVGDIVEYAYIIKGENPLLKEKINRPIYFNYSDPIGRLYTKIICPSEATLELKRFNGAAEPEKTSDGKNTIYCWDLQNVPAFLSEDQLPDWYDPYSNIELSEYRSWGDVAGWALPLYKLPLSSPQIDNKVDQVKNQFPDAEDQVRACIEFVQDEVRYLGFEGGVQGYKPNPPQRVFDQRFGDCKDKSLLLTYMLRKLGIESYPALVHTSMGKVLPESLPSPTSFNHCIVQMNFRDSIYWIDPTMTLQRGKLKFRASPNYYHGLVIDKETSALTPIAESEQASTISVAEDYFVEAVGAAASLTVRSVYNGSEADGIRNYWKSTNANEIKKSYTNFYANDYPDIRATKNVEFTDYEKENMLVVVEEYTIPHFWSFDSTSGQQKAEFYARIIAGYLTKPSTKGRRMPLRIAHPTDVDQIITVHLPEKWSVEEDNERISSAGFVYTGSTRYADKRIVLSHSYRSLRHHLEVDATRDHIKKVDDALGNLSFQITYGSPQNIQAVSGDSPNRPFVIVALLAAIGFFLILKNLYQHDPRSRDYDVAYESVGGWILLPAFGLFVTPIREITSLFADGYFDNSWWRSLTDASYSYYNPSHSMLVLFSLIFTIFVIEGSILLIILLIKRRTSFPLLMVGFIAINVVFNIVNAIWLTSVTTLSPFNSHEMYVLIVAAAIWIPYFMFSDRVKGTFLERLQR